MNDDAANHDNEGTSGEEDCGGGDDDDDGDLGLSDRLSVGVTPQLLSPSSPSPLLMSHSVELVALRYCK